MCEVNVNTENLKSVIADLESLTNHLKSMLQESPESKTAQKKNPDSKKPKAEKKNCSLEEVRAILAEKSRAGLTAKVKELIAKYGADKLSDVDPKYYADLAKEAGELANG